ncbi:hypothetical protein [Acidovorax sp. Q11]
MTFSTEELILAAHVRELAVALRLKAFDAAEVAADMKYKGEADFGYEFGSKSGITKDAARQKVEEHNLARGAFEKDWLATNPVANFAPEALSLITAVATAIKQPST